MCLTSRNNTSTYSPSLQVQNFLSSLQQGYISPPLYNSQQSSQGQITSSGIAGIVIALIIVVGITVIILLYLNKKRTKTHEKVVIKTLTNSDTGIPKKMKIIYSEPQKIENPLLIANTTRSKIELTATEKERIEHAPIQVNPFQNNLTSIHVPKPPLMRKNPLIKTEKSDSYISPSQNEVILKNLIEQPSLS